MSEKKTQQEYEIDLLDLAKAMWSHIVAIVLAAVCGLSVLLWDSFAPLAAAVCYWLAAWYAFRQLDGMSGDVSGFALTIAELGGAAVLVLWR